MLSTYLSCVVVFLAMAQWQAELKSYSTSTDNWDRWARHLTQAIRYLAWLAFVVWVLEGRCR